MIAQPRQIANDFCTGEIFDYGAQLSAWKPRGASESLIWMSRHSRFETGRAIRGGVPICFPWFGSGTTGKKTPAHGLARLSNWNFIGQNILPDGSTSVFYAISEVDFGPQLANTREKISPFNATLTVNFGPKLHLEFRVKNTGDQDFNYEIALHTYLRVADARTCTISGLEGEEYLDKVGGGRNRQAGEVHIAGEVDRIYLTEKTLRVSDPQAGSYLEIEKTGSANTIVWNPWIEKSQAMADFGDEEYRGMLCVEAGNVGDNAITLTPASSHTLSYTLSAGSLSGN